MINDFLYIIFHIAISWELIEIYDICIGNDQGNWSKANDSKFFQVNILFIVYSGYTNFHC